MYSERVLRIKPYTPGEQTKDKSVIKLNTNENPYPPSKECERVLREFPIDNLKRYPDPTCEKLREAIAELEGVNPENVYVGNGSDEVLAFCFAAFFPCKNGKVTLFPVYTYSFYSVFCEFFETQGEEVPMNFDFSINPSLFYDKNYNEQCRPYACDKNGIVWANPNAPTSLLSERAEIEKVLKRNYGAMTIVDEAYIDFAPKGNSCVPLTKIYRNIMVVKTLSKSYSLAGLRVGYAIGSPEHIKAVYAMKDCINSYPVDSIAEAVAIAAIKDTAYHEECVNKIINTRERVIKKLKELGYFVLQSATNFVFTMPPVNSGVAFMEYLRQNNVLARHFNRSAIANFVRVTIGSDSEMDVFLRLAESFLTTTIIVNKTQK